MAKAEARELGSASRGIHLAAGLDAPVGLATTAAHRARGWLVPKPARKGRGAVPARPEASRLEREVENRGYRYGRGFCRNAVRTRKALFFSGSCFCCRCCPGPSPLGRKLACNEPGQHFG